MTDLYYNHKTDRTAPALPAEIPWGNGIRRRPHISDDQYRAEGWITTPVERMDIPVGYMIDPATHSIEADPDLNTAREIGELIEIPPPPDMPPEPSVVVADLSSVTGEPSGKTYRMMCVDGVPYATLNSSSPQLPGTDQTAAIIAMARAHQQRRQQAAAIPPQALAGGLPELKRLLADLAAIVAGESAIDEPTTPGEGARP